MLLRGFEHSCGGCHSEQMSDLPLDIVRIPVDLFDSATTNVGPGDTILDFDRAAWIEKRETGIMRLLLASNSEIRDARDSLINRREKEGTAGLANAVQLYAAGMRELVADLLDADPTNLAERLGNIELADTDHENWHLLASTLLPHLSGADRQRLLDLFADATTSVDETSDDEVDDDPLEDADRISTSEQRIGRSSPRWSLQADGDAWTLAYHPQGHGDVLLKRWLETAATRSTADSASAFARGEVVSPWEQVFAELSGLAAPGRCMKCHTANENADDGLQVAWAARRSSMGVRGFTDFVHGPHLTPQQNVDCTSCHQLMEPVDDKIVLFRPEFIHRENTVNTNPHAVETSGFEPLQKSNCAECHQHNLAGDKCLTCHNYHVNSLDHVISGSREPSVTK